MKTNHFRFDERYLELGRSLLSFIGQKHKLPQSPFIIFLAGQSGCGKTVAAHALRILLERGGASVLLLHQDDYFHLPSLYNHYSRLSDIAWVGTDEVNLLLLNKHIRDFRNRLTIYAPEANHELNVKEYSVLDTSDYQVLIVEGTYVSMLEGADCRIFFSANYKETETNRRLRGRDKIDEFTNKILLIELGIITSHESLADIIIDKHYHVRFQDT